MNPWADDDVWVDRIVVLSYDTNTQNKELEIWNNIYDAYRERRKDLDMAVDDVEDLHITKMG